MLYIAAAFIPLWIDEEPPDRGERAKAVVAFLPGGRFRLPEKNRQAFGRGVCFLGFICSSNTLADALRLPHISAQDRCVRASRVFRGRNVDGHHRSSHMLHRVGQAHVCCIIWRVQYLHSSVALKTLTQLDFLRAVFNKQQRFFGATVVCGSHRILHQPREELSSTGGRLCSSSGVHTRFGVGVRTLGGVSLPYIQLNGYTSRGHAGRVGF